MGEKKLQRSFGTSLGFEGELEEDDFGAKTSSKPFLNEIFAF